MRSSLGVALSFAVLSSLAACAPATPALAEPRGPLPSSLAPWLDEVARTEPPPGHRALLVVYPRTACSASARTVFMDEKGTFFGAVAPGEATLLTFPTGTRTLLAISTVEVNAPARTNFSFDDIVVPPAPDALLLEGSRVNARQCSKTGQYASTSIVSKDEIEARLGDAEITWVEPRLRAGQAWLDAHEARVDELLDRRPAGRPPIVHRSSPP